MATSQPIALPASNQDYTMGSYSASPHFNPASYTRHFLGSPISWRAGSFSARFPQGSPSAQLFSSLDHPKSPSSVEVMNAFNVFDREGELCRNYTCCGIHLQDLHALLEHFEEVHVLVVDPTVPAQLQVPFNPIFGNIINPHQHPQSLSHPPYDTDDMELELDLDNSTHPPPHPASTRSSPSSVGPSPPHTPINPAHYQYAQYQHHTPYTSAHTSPYTSQPPSPGSATSNNPPSNNNPAGILHPHPHPQMQPVGMHFPHAGPGTPAVLTHPEDAFNAYARFTADYSSRMPGTQSNASGGEEIVVNEYAGVGAGGYVPQIPGHGVMPVGGTQTQGQQCIPPALLFASTSQAATRANGDTGVVVSNSGVTVNGNGNGTSSKLKLKVRGGGGAIGLSASTPSTPAALTPPSTLNTLNPNNNTSSPSVAHPSPSSPATAPPTPLPPTTSLLLSKPFRCPKPNCNKSYKQANGLKYHMTHGSCNFAPPKDLEHVKDLLERKRREREASGLARSASLGSAVSGGGGVGGSGVNGISGINGIGGGANVGRGGEALLANMTHTAYGDLGSITETELREVEREAEKRVRPFACGVGDCQRRYKNMNGLRYHYQHSGDHGAVGLALLAGGLHECLASNQNQSQHQNQSRDQGHGGGGEGKGKGKAEEREREREGRKRGGGPVRTTTAARGGGGGGSGSASVPVSRAGSVSRVGTPVHYSHSGTGTPFTSSHGTGFAQSGTTTPFTPAYTNLSSQQGQGQGQGQGQQTPGTTPPLTPLTAAVQGLGLGPSVGMGGVGVGVRSQPHSPTHHHALSNSNSPSPHLQHQQQNQHQQNQQQNQQNHQQQQQQLAYQAQFVELQRRQYLAQAQAQQQQAQYEQQMQMQYQYVSAAGVQGQGVQGVGQGQGQGVQGVGIQGQGGGQGGGQGQGMDYVDVDVQAQREFVEAQRREFELRQQGGVEGMDVAMT